MNSIDLRTEKANAIFRHQTNFQTITTLFRLIEICVFLVLISTFSSQLPFSVRISTDYFKQISFAGISPRFVFVIGNVIILTLLFKSRAKENDDSLGKIDVYDECVRRCQKSLVNRTTDVILHDNNNNLKKKIYRSQSEKMMRFESNDSEKYRKLTRSVTDRRILKLNNIEFCAGEKPSPEKVMSVESHRKLTRSVTGRRILTNVDGCGGEKPSPEKVKRSPEICRKALPEISRSQSEKMMRVECKESESERKLRRTVTEREMLRNDDSSSVVPERNVEELSSEAFRRTVEEFIARQQQSLRDEELAPVPYVVGA
ncbi:hypothetical protein Hdeb2414_s0004g00129201 [Helianthus debilis subsp. tardiflorus]